MTTPKIYRTDTPTSLFAKAMTGSGEPCWTLIERANGGTFIDFVLSVGDPSGTHFEGWSFSRERLSNLWEMISEALHHD